MNFGNEQFPSLRKRQIFIFNCNFSRLWYCEPQKLITLSIFTFAGFEKELPVTADVCKLAKQYNQRLDGWLLYGGEDYELLFTVKKENLKSLQDLARSQKTLVSVIGEITSRKKGVKIKNRESRVEDLLPRGWDHLKTR